MPPASAAPPATTSATAPGRPARRWSGSSRAGSHTVVDLGAGTGALSRLLVGRADEVVAVEPDARMRAVLTDAVPGVRAVEGRGESMPLPDASVDAVIASSSWHWVDLVPALHEVGRVLVPGGVLGASGPVPTRSRPFIAEPQELLGGGGGSARRWTSRAESELSAAVNDRAALTGPRDPTGGPLRPARAHGADVGCRAQRRRI